MTSHSDDIIKYIPRHHRLLPPQPGEAFLNEVAMLFREMPYGDLVKFCQVTGADSDFLWKWAYGRR